MRLQALGRCQRAGPQLRSAALNGHESPHIGAIDRRVAWSLTLNGETDGAMAVSRAARGLVLVMDGVVMIIRRSSGDTLARRKATNFAIA